MSKKVTMTPISNEEELEAWFEKSDELLVGKGKYRSDFRIVIDGAGRGNAFIVGY